MYRARTGLSLLFFVLAQLLGLLLWLVYISTWTRWQGGLGLIIGVFTIPGLVVFPLIFWAVEDRFPLGYVIALAVTVALMMLAGVTANDE